MSETSETLRAPELVTITCNSLARGSDGQLVVNKKDVLVNTSRLSEYITIVPLDDSKDSVVPVSQAQNENKVDPNDPSTFKYLTSVGHRPVEPFVPLMYDDDVSIVNDELPEGVSPAFYVMQHCSFSAANIPDYFDMSRWVRMQLVEHVVHIASGKADLTPHTRVHVLPGSYFRSKDSGQTIAADIFMRKLKQYLSNHFTPDASWKRAIVFDEDMMGYTVCY